MAELAAAFDMAGRYGYEICQPMSPQSYDFIAVRGDEDDYEAVRVQVKTVRRRARNGKEWLVVDCTNGKGRRYRRNTVDLFAAYDAKEERVFYIRYADLRGARERWIDPAKIYQM